MPSVTCPHCGHTFDPALVALSPVARRILCEAPETFRRGKYTSIRTLARHVGYSAPHTLTGLRELAAAGYVEAVRNGGRHRYIGIPTMLMRLSSHRAA